MQHSVFSGGLHGQGIAIAEALKPFGTVDLINRTQQTWWDDCESVKGAWTVVSLADASGYDLCVECGPPLAAAERFAKKHVWVTTNFLIKEIEQCIFPVATVRRDLSGLAEIWTTDTETQALQVLTGLPVRTIPFIWTPTFIEAYLADKPAWTPGPWKIHCIETQVTNTSSCVLPLVIARELRARGTPIESVRLHNAEAVAAAKFFQENTLRLCADTGLNVDVFGRQRFADWLFEPGSCVIAHTRFKPIRPALLDLVWCGIPFIHNSPMLADAGFQDTYYHENSVGDAVEAFQRLTAPDRLKGRAQLAQWSPAAARPAFDVILGIKAPVKPVLRIGFCDMWFNFDPSYNFFTLLLKHVAPHLEIVGGLAQGTEDLVIFGPFGDDWKRLPPGQPKVHFTGENTPPIPEAQLNLGFEQRYMAGENYLRFPLWLLEIDWFGADPSKIRNPIPIPLSLCTNPPKGQRDRFCAFVVSNPMNPVRNAAFKSLDAWKRVDSAGAVFNTMGPGLFAGAGGGGGEARKVEFLKDYRFCITYENSSAPGYCTEKLLHAKAAGCVPIYWGDPYVERDFDPAGFIDARAFRTPEELVAAVRRVEEDPALWGQMAAVPALNEYKVEWARRLMAELGRRLLELSSASPQPETYVINLDRRPDRLKRLTVKAKRWPAVDGRTIQLTPGLRQLLANNDFFWKKAVAGCALSHLGLWTQLYKSEAPGYLILEDDAVLEPGWLDAWNRLEMPGDTDIVYLGGVLPPNKTGFATAIETVGPGLGRIKLNQLFGQPVPSRYFHLCAYAYYLTARGAKRVVEAVLNRGIWTSADHILCSLNAYVMTPLVAGCYQDDDPVYQASKFNDFSRIDSFDSDLWNNNERFFETPASDVPFACVEPIELSGLYEYEWLCELFGNPKVLAVASLEAAPPNPIVIVQGPYLQKTREALLGWKKPFRILHLSDEGLRDPVEFYDNPFCKGVIRNYARPNTRALTIPLGYHWRPTGNSVPKLPFRTKVWSFVGTEWDRRAELRGLPQDRAVLRLFPTWQDPANLGKAEYLELMLDSVFVPCPAGQNAETFRIYEAIECGAVPLIVGSNPTGLPLLPLESWTQAGECMAYFLANMEQLEAYREKLFEAWATLKGGLKKGIRSI